MMFIFQKVCFLIGQCNAYKFDTTLLLFICWRIVVSMGRNS
jgi:hypothetical protein